MGIKHCIGCDSEFHRENNLRVFCGRCKKIARDMFYGSKNEFISEMADLKKQVMREQDAS